MVDDGSAGEETLAASGAPRNRLHRRAAAQRRCPVPRGTPRSVLPGATCIVPLDADDVLAPDFLESAAEAWLRAGERSLVTALVSWFVERRGAPTERGSPGVSRGTSALPERRLDGDRAHPARPAGRGRRLRRGDWMPTRTGICTAGSARRRGRPGPAPRFLFHYRQRPGSRTKVQGRAGRDRLIARMFARYPELPLAPDRTLRLFLAEAAPPLRNSCVGRRIRPCATVSPTRSNTALKKLPGLHGGATRLLSRRCADSGGQHPDRAVPRLCHVHLAVRADRKPGGEHERGGFPGPPPRARCRRML